MTPTLVAGQDMTGVSQAPRGSADGARTPTVNKPLVRLTPSMVDI
jgi:hypothetical protein